MDILGTANDQTIPVLAIHEAKLQIRQQTITHKVFIAEILDDVLFGLDIMYRNMIFIELYNPTSNSLHQIRIGEDVVLFP